MHNWATDHSTILSEFASIGAPITFSVATSEQDPETEQITVSTTRVSGRAVQIRGESKRYADLGLNIQRQPLTLLFAADVYGNVPAVGASATWRGATYFVMAVDETAPSGTVLFSRLVLGR